MKASIADVKIEYRRILLPDRCLSRTGYGICGYDLSEDITQYGMSPQEWSGPLEDPQASKGTDGDCPTEQYECPSCAEEVEPIEIPNRENAEQTIKTLQDLAVAMKMADFPALQVEVIHKTNGLVQLEIDRGGIMLGAAEEAVFGVYLNGIGDESGDHQAYEEGPKVSLEFPFSPEEFDAALAYCITKSMDLVHGGSIDGSKAEVDRQDV